MNLLGLKTKGPNLDRPDEVLFDPQTDLYVSWYLRRRLTEEVARATRYGRPLSLIACVPQALPGESIRQLVKQGGPFFRRLLRHGDHAGLLEGEVVAIGLPETPASGARVLAQRLRTELGVRRTPEGRRVWLVGWASLPEHGASVDALVQAALEATKESRLRAA